MVGAADIRTSTIGKHEDSFYRPGLDMFRAFAFFLVFCAHGLIHHLDKPTQLGSIGRTGEFGVCLFFFLSSYLITELLLREKRDTGTIHIRSFFARRILRIWPLYFFMIAVGCLYGLFSPTDRVSLAWGLSLLGLLTNWYTVRHGYPPGFLFPLWSISLEEQFYLLWPWLAKYLRADLMFAIASLLMIAAYLTLAVLLHRGQSLDPAVWTNSLVQFQFFALGAMAALLLRGRLPKLPNGMMGILFVAGLLCLRAAQAAVFSNDPHLPHYFQHIAPRYLVALAGCLCLFFSFLPLPAGGFQKPFIYLGKISYGLYVYHRLCLSGARLIVERLARSLQISNHAGDLLVIALALPLTVALATLSYRFLESPFLRIKKRFTVVLSRPI
jgi:peptidoglycan/LPS O-acetylase OafA/YrhL